jgi:phospholipid/cholesterol/gamma-HCH transport system substrate-binding protein
VQQINMEPNATVRVKVSLDDEYVHLIGQDAKARLVKEALVGESVVEIIPGSQQVRQVTQNSVLEFERGQDASTVVESLAAQLQPILGDIRQITSSGDIQQTLKNLNQASGDFRDTVRQFTQVGINSNKAVTSLNSTLETLDQAIPRLVDKADKTLDNVQSATSDIKKITSDSAAEIPALVRNTNALVEDGQETLGGVKKSWLLNSLFPESEEQTLPVDGYVPPRQ